MSTRKIITIISSMSAAILAYYAITKEFDIFIGIALILSMISIALNIYYEVKHGRKEY